RSYTPVTSAIVPPDTPGTSSASPIKPPRIAMRMIVSAEGLVLSKLTPLELPAVSAGDCSDAAECEEYSVTRGTLRPNPCKRHQARWVYFRTSGSGSTQEQCDSPVLVWSVRPRVEGMANTETCRLGVWQGEGIGPEIVAPTVQAVALALQASGEAVPEFVPLLLGREAIDATGRVVP